jgi:hypothetical protein
VCHACANLRGASAARGHPEALHGYRASLNRAEHASPGVACSSGTELTYSPVKRNSACQTPSDWTISQ